MLSKGETRIAPATGRSAATWVATALPRLRPKSTMREVSTSGRLASASNTTSASAKRLRSDGLPSLAP